jgi:hypothetical protein
VSVIQRALDIYSATAALSVGIPLSEFLPDGDPRIVAPFGRPITMPEYRWRLSSDVWIAICDYAGMNEQEPSPASRLLGWPVVIDEALPPNSMVLEAS